MVKLNKKEEKKEEEKEDEDSEEEEEEEDDDDEGIDYMEGLKRKRDELDGINKKSKIDEVNSAPSVPY